MENKQQPSVNPWKGLRAYREGETLYGRDDEIRSLSHYIMNNSQTVLYGRSGIGKSSILNAGVFPVIRKEGLYPVSIRLDHTSPVGYVGQIAAAMKAEGLTAHELVPVLDKDRESLWEFLHRQYFTSAKEDRAVHPLLVFDQFEEIFTLQQNEKVKLQFFGELGDLLNEVRPSYLSGPETEEETGPSEGPAEKLDLDSLFEEGKDSATHYLEYPGFHMVFALREDFLSYLERYTSFIPVMKYNRFALQPINEEQAADIIMKPCPGLVDKTVTTLIIRKVTGRTDFEIDEVPEIEVDSAVLSLYLSRLYEKKDKEADIISPELVKQFGDDIIKEFYRDSIAGLDPGTVELLEEVLLTGEGRRNNVSRTDLLARGLAEDILTDLVDRRKLLRQFSYGNDIRIELIHDVLCPTVRQHIQDRELDAIKEDRKKQEALRHLENRRRNQQRARNDLDVLTIRGRNLLDNRKDFGSFVDIFDGSPVIPDRGVFALCRHSLLEFNLRYQEHESIEFSDLGKVVGVKGGDTFSTSLEFRDENDCAMSTRDGIERLTLEYSGDRISRVFFLEVFGYSDDGEGYEVFSYRNGYCGIALEYDEEGREIRRTYLDEEGYAVPTVNRYARVDREYDELGNISQVTYFDPDGNPCPHTDGNYGFRSEYDEDGQEIRRIFLDASGAPVNVISGIAGRVFKYDEAGRLSEESNLGVDLQPAPDCEGYMAVSFDYDAESRLSRETYRDFSGNPVCNAERYAVTDYYYRSEGEGLVMDQIFADVEGHPVAKEDGSFGSRSIYDKQYHLTELGDLDEKGEYAWWFRAVWDDGVVPSRLQFKKSEETYWLLFDDHSRYIFQYGLLDEEGKKEETLRGGYGYEIERDPDTGFPLAEVNIDRYNQAVPDDEGIYRKVFVRVSTSGRILEERFEDRDGRPKEDSEGAFGCFHEYDQRGNETLVAYLGSDGKPAPLKGSLQVYEKEEYDEEGNLVSVHNFDIDMHPTQSDIGVFGYLIERSDRKRRTTFVDENDRPVDCTMGFCYIERDYDDRDRVIRLVRYTRDGSMMKEPDGYWIRETVYDDVHQTETVRYLDEEGNPVDTKDGYACVRIDRDDQGRLVRWRSFDKDGQAVCDEDGEYGYAVEYGEKGRSTYRISLGADGQPMTTKSGYCGIKREFDSQGREEQRYFYDENRKPVKTERGYGFRTLYTEQGNRFVYVTLDADGNPTPYPTDTYTAIERTMDSSDRTILERYLDEQLQPIAILSGGYGRSWLYEEDGFEEVCCLDPDGNPMPDASGIVYRLRQRDAQGREVFLQLFGLDHEPVLGKWGTYSVKTFFGEHDCKIVFMDQDGQPMLNHEGDAGFYRDYDDQGRQILELWLAPDDRLQPNEYGICGWRQVFGEDGSIDRITLGPDMAPAPDENGVYGRHSEYEGDIRVSQTCLDAEGNPIRCSAGWITRKFILDDDGDPVGELYFDTDGNPMPDEDGDYGVRSISSGSENIRILAFLGADGKPHANREGVYFLKRILDEEGRTVARFELDKHMVPIKQDDGTFGEGYEYLEDGSRMIFGLDEEGNRIPDEDGWAGWKKTTDEKGRTVRAEWFDAENRPIANVDGDYGRETVYLDDENAEIVYGLDENGMRHYDKNGISGVKTTYFDGESHYVETCVDPEGNPMQDKDGFSSKEVWKDEQGREIKTIRFSTEGSLWFDDEGFCGCLYRYVINEDGDSIKRFANLGKDGEPVIEENGIMFYEGWLDDEDRRVRKLWFDADMRPVADEKGDYGVEYGYVGESKTPIRFVSLDEEANPHNNRYGYSTEIRIVDKDGIVQSIFLDVDGKLVKRTKRRWLS